ncbi:pectate lyase [Cellulomonas sp. JZ18]|uniref:pectate lyase n=1 Tax=Cellulomonas sp. JZ18 TaxID=2654191 RepID=UPI001E2E8A38|nr:pectate lyase [Cellulomonas sp. JZ18]
MTASAATVDPSAWYVLVSRKSDKVLEVRDGSLAAGAVLQQGTRTDAAAQQFRFVASGDGRHRLQNRQSGKVVEVAGASTADGAAVRQATDADAAHQQVRLVAQSSYVRLVLEHSDKVLQVAGASRAAGAAITQGTDAKSYHQQWELVKVATGAPTTAPTTSPTATPRPTSSPAPTATATPRPTSSPSPTGAPGTFPAWPTATGEQKVSATITVSGTRDLGLVRYHGISSGDQGESQPPMFQLADGAVLRNVILGEGAGDGIHCLGTCTLENVWWENVGEDAATFKGTSASQTMTVVGGGARGASDKVFQHNGPGTFVIRNFQVSDFGKLYRSCGNCSKQYARTVRVEDVRVTAPGKSLVGINSNLGDRATLTGVTIVGDPSRKIVVCEEYKGVTSGEPSKVGSGPSAACGYSTASVTYR